MRTLALLTLITAFAAPITTAPLKVPDEPSYEDDGINHADDLDPGPSALDSFALKVPVKDGHTLALLIAEKKRLRLALKMSDNSGGWIC